MYLIKTKSLRQELLFFMSSIIKKQTNKKRCQHLVENSLFLTVVLKQMCYNSKVGEYVAPYLSLSLSYAWFAWNKSVPYTYSHSHSLLSVCMLIGHQLRLHYHLIAAGFHFCNIQYLGSTKIFESTEILFLEPTDIDINAHLHNCHNTYDS